MLCGMSRLFATALDLVPKHELSFLIGRAAAIRLPRVLRGPVLRAFAGAYGVDVGEAEKPLGEYRSVSELFTRRLAEGARVVDAGGDAVVSPCDGRVSEHGTIRKGEMMQVKGRHYHVATLLDDDAEGERCEGGSYLTIYLAPYNYHRVHAPFGGELLQLSYMPGALYPVFPRAVESVEALFAINERVAMFFESAELGRFVVVMVGALGVGSIELTFSDLRTNTSGSSPRRQRFAEALRFAKGDDLGTFNFGSTVIVLFEAGKASLVERLTRGEAVKMGERVATRCR